jgi:hypothetical protein
LRRSKTEVALSVLAHNVTRVLNLIGPRSLKTRLA